MHINVETKTALLKGYAHSGMMLKGTELFMSMCLSEGKPYVFLIYLLRYILVLVHRPDFSPVLARCQR
jgi:pentatricopeptide repeat protein